MTKNKEIIVSLAELDVNDKGHIAYLQTKDTAKMHKLLSIGAIPGVSVTLLQKFPSYVFRIGHSQFAIDKELAQRIYVAVSK